MFLCEICGNHCSSVFEIWNKTGVIDHIEAVACGACYKINRSKFTIQLQQA